MISTFHVSLAHQIVARIGVGLILVLLSGCGDRPCSPDAAVKAAEAYRHCIEMPQDGDGGYACGAKAYVAFCKAKDR